MSKLSLGLLLFCVACGGSRDDDVATGDDANLTDLGVPKTILDGVFYEKPGAIDQSGLGVILAPGAALADGATSGSLPSRTTLDRKPIAKMRGVWISAGEDRFGIIFDTAGASSDWKLANQAVPPQMDPADMKVGMSCRVLGTQMDMYAAGPPKALSLEAKIESVRPQSDGSWHAIARTTVSTGGEGSLLVCGGKLAGIHAGGGSQGTTFEYRSLDRALFEAIERARR